MQRRQLLKHPSRERRDFKDLALGIFVGFCVFALWAGVLYGCASAYGSPIASEVERVDAALVRSGLVKRLAPEVRRGYVMSIVAAARKHKVDPLLISAIAWIESRWTNLRVNRTKDYGILQVHWQPREPWLKGIKRADLYNTNTNIRVGTAELASARAWCRRHKHTRKQHHWSAHYRWGVRVKARKYDRAVMYIYHKLKRVAQPRNSI